MNVEIDSVSQAGNENGKVVVEAQNSSTVSNYNVAIDEPGSAYSKGAHPQAPQTTYATILTDVQAARSQSIKEDSHSDLRNAAQVQRTTSTSERSVIHGYGQAPDSLVLAQQRSQQKTVDKAVVSANHANKLRVTDEPTQQRGPGFGHK